MSRWIGHVIGNRYRIRALVGRGGMGEVYEAEHLRSGRSLAIKVLVPQLDGLGDEPTTTLSEWVSRFKREAQAASLLDHDHIVEVLDLGLLDDGMLFSAMEFVDGDSLDHLIEQRALGPRRALVLTRQVLDALGYAHDRDVVHRDLKPENIMVVAGGQPGAQYDLVKLVDFGLVKLIGELAGDLGHERLTRTGIVFGTPDYIAPEQALGRLIDGRADLYSLGVTLFEMLVGERPFCDENPMNVVRMHVTKPAPALADLAPGQAWCTPEMEALVAGALTKQPEQRFADAAAMMEALDRAFLSISHLPPEL